MSEETSSNQELEKLQREVTKRQRYLEGLINFVDKAVNRFR